MSGAWIAAFVVLWLVVILLAVVALGLLRRVTAVLEQVEWRIGTATPSAEVFGVPPGSVVPPFRLVDIEGRTVTSDEAVRAPTILLFMGLGCKPCESLAEELTEADAEVDGLSLMVVVQAEPDTDLLSSLHGATVLFDSRLEAAQAFRSSATPVAFVVDRGGFVMDRTIPSSLDDLRVLALRQKGGAVEQPA